ncbi:hypothetical protein C1646_769094 [Rhizophagus diaphanus]|nr:hypothetical protein C1646_769094 [Rhizophagus diaphanus] [Rhizophagus sp. MUCL 43196]
MEELKRQFNFEQTCCNRRFRKWRKILNSEKLDDLLMYNFKKEFDWQSTLEYVSNGISYTRRQSNQQDMRDRLYCIKNLLKELPSYDTLFKRGTNKIENDICKRCDRNEVEKWGHIWLCEANATSIDKVLQESIYKFET